MSIKKLSKKSAAVLSLAIFLTSTFSATSAAAASMPGGRLIGEVEQDKYIPANMTKIAMSDSDTVIDETYEASSSTLTKNLNKVFNMDDVRTGSGIPYSSKGVAYYDEQNGRGVSYVPLTGNNSVFGVLSSPFGADERFVSGSTIYTSPRSANNVATLYKTLREEADDGTPIVKSISNAADFFNRLAAFYHALQQKSDMSKVFSTTLKSDGKIMPLSETDSLGTQAYNGYGPEFESDDIRGKAILNGGLLTAEGNDMVNGAKSFVGTSDNPYGDLFDAKDNIIEDSYILIRRLLGVDGQSKDGLLSAKTMPTQTTVSSTPWMNSVFSSAKNIKSSYEYYRNNFTTDKVNEALNWLNKRQACEPRLVTSGRYSWTETGVNQQTGSSYADGVSYRICYWVSTAYGGHWHTDYQAYKDAWNKWWRNTLDGLIYYYEMYPEGNSIFAKNYSELLRDNEEYQEILEELPEATEAYYDAIKRFNEDSEDYWVSSMKALFPDAYSFDKYCFKSDYTKQYYAQYMHADRYGNKRRIGDKFKIEESSLGRYKNDNRNDNDNDYYYYDITYEYEFTFTSTNPAQAFIEAGGTYDEFLASFYIKGGSTGKSRSLNQYLNLSYWTQSGGYSNYHGSNGSMHYADAYSTWAGEDSEALQKAFDRAFQAATNSYNPHHQNMAVISEDLKNKLKTIEQSAPTINDSEYHQYKDYKDLTERKKQIESTTKSLSYIAMDGVSCIQDIKNIVNQIQGPFQKKARNDYDSNHPSDYQQYKNAVDLFDVSGYNIDFDTQRYSENDIENANFTTADGIDALLWYLWVSEGRDQIPKDCPVSTIEDWIGDKDYSDKVLAFRKWLIKNELYINEAYTAGHKYTLDPDIWDGGNLLELWAAVYYSPSVDNVSQCLEKTNHAYYGDDSLVRDLQSISEGIVSSTEETGYNKLNNTPYSYLEGYTNASFIPKQTAVADYSVFDNAMAFYQKFGMNSDKNNIPAEKHMNLGFYKDVMVTGYSNNVVQTSAILGRYEWYVYYDEGGNRENAEVVYHNTTTMLNCPFTAIQKGTYWIDCYQSGYTTYEERLQYTLTYFLTEEITHTVLMSSLAPDIQIKLDEKTVAEKVKLQTDEDGYVVDEAAMQWRAYGNRVVENFTTQRVSDDGEVKLG